MNRKVMAGGGKHGARVNILVVDDESAIREGVTAILKRADFNVFAARDVETASNALKRSEFHLLILDLLFPGIGGLQFLEEVRSIRPELMVLIISGYISTETTITAFNAGALDFLPKPFTKQELLQHVFRLRKRMNLKFNENTFRNPDRLYFGEHTWVKWIDEEYAEIGIQSRFLMTIGEITEIRTWVNGFELQQGGYLAEVICADGTAFVLWSPVTGRIEEVNPEFPSVSGHGKLHADDNWIIRSRLLTWDRDKTNLKTLEPEAKR